MKRKIGIFWDYENARLPTYCNLGSMSVMLRKTLQDNESQIVERNIYYDSQAPSEIKTNRVDLDMGGWRLIDCPKRQKKETLDKKLIVDVMFFVANSKMKNEEVGVCLISGDGDFCYVMNRIRDLGVYTTLFYPEMVTFRNLIADVHEAYVWEKSFTSEEENEKETIELENTTEIPPIPKKDPLLVFLLCIHEAQSKNKHSTQGSLDALVADMWYKRILKEGVAATQETKDNYKSIRRKSTEDLLIAVTENRENPSHITKYLELTNKGMNLIKNDVSFTIN